MPRGNLLRGRALAKLTLDQEQFVVRLAAQFVPVKEIHALVKERFAVDIALTTIYHIQSRKRYAPLLDRYRQEWAMEVASCPLAHKKYRLERLMKLVDAVDRNPRLSEDAKERRLKGLLQDARMEMEEKKTEFNTLYLTNINQYSDEELVQKREELLKRIESIRLPVRSTTHGIRDGREVIETAGRETAPSDGGTEEVRDQQDDGGGAQQPEERLAREGQVDAES